MANKEGEARHGRELMTGQTHDTREVSDERENQMETDGKCEECAGDRD